MQKRVLISFVVFCLIFLTSCDSISNLNLPFLSGQVQSVGKGVKVDILQSPNKDLSESEPFQFRFRVTNYNPQTLEGKLCLTALYVVPNDPLPSNDCQDVNLEASQKIDNKVIETSNEYFFPSESASYKYSKVRKDVAQTASFQANFKYQVAQTAATPLCIKLPLSKQSCPDQEILNPEQTELPLKVTKIEKKVSASGNNQVQLTLLINIEKNQEGDLMPKSQVLEEKMSFDPVVSMHPEFTGSKIDFNCPSLKDGTFNFGSGKAKQIKCFVNLAMSQEIVQENLLINLDYGFNQHISLPTVQLMSSDQTA